METLNTNLKNLSKNKIHLILIGLAAIIFATVLIYAYVEFSGTRISVVSNEEGKPYCGAIGSRSEGWYIDSGFNRPELIRWDKCKGCSAICKAIGSRSEGWYSSCDNRLIKWDNCGEGHEEGNLPPVIDGLTAPTRLQINEKGVWTIKARDPENGALSYSVRWGLPSIAAATAELDKKSQTTTFTHSYAQAGIYTIDFIITDNYQQTAEASTTIEVVSKISEATCTDSDGGINKYVKGKTCRELHYNSSAAVSCKTDMCDGLCYSQSTSTNLDGKESNIISSSHGDPTSTNLKKDHKTPSLPPYYKDFPPIEPPIPNNLINSESPFVKEYYCEGDRIFSKLIHCESGCKDGACLKKGEEDCTPEGIRQHIGDPVCCDGLIQIGNDFVDSTGHCNGIDDGSHYCAKCGNGICGLGENRCNCPEDCEGVCHKDLNKEECESFGGEYKSACTDSGDCHYWCECPCKTDSDCPVNRCGQGRCYGLSPYNPNDSCCYESTYKCVDEKCEYTNKTYKNHSCAAYYNSNSPTPEKCLDTCGDGVCKSPENKLWCPEDCKEEITCISDVDCSESQFCQFPDCSAKRGATGICIEEPELCPEIYSPVCGCDGKTYSNDCMRQAARVSKKHNDRCECTIAGERAILPFNCCAGLKLVSDCVPGEQCPISVKYCVDCGNKVCEKYENLYNCPKDCKVSCRDENYGCSIDNIPCCPGLKSSALYGDPNGDCSIMANCGTICIPCGNGICDANEGICNCPEDCKTEDCIPEGSSVNTSGMQKCCAGLKAISCARPNSQGECHNEDFNCDSFPCANCGNGICGLGENKCNCPEDCIKEEKLSADLNCDEKVNLVDMAILLSWWSKDSSDQNSNVNQDGIVEVEICSPCKNPDINQDGKINLVDFSIMMSQWTK